MSFSGKVKEDALVACARHCCICHRFCGLKIELHHIEEEREGGADSFENCIPLCFDCHADMRSYDHRHPKGTKYSRQELMRHRDIWYQKVLGSVGIASDGSHRELDQTTFDLIRRILPAHGSIAFLRENNFAAFSFSWESLRDVEAVLAARVDPAFEFIDADLEGSLGQLIAAARKLMTALSYKTFPLDHADRSSVPPEWEETMPETFADAVREIHDAASELCRAYDDLVRLARRKLGATASGVPSEQLQQRLSR